MNIDDDPLTPAERALERELAERLARLGPQREPGPALDARILAAAHAAVPPRTRRPRRKAATWPAVFGIAASVVFALGLAWKLRPQPAPVVVQESTRPAEEPLADYTPPPAAEVHVPRPRRVLEVPAPPPAQAPARTRGTGARAPVARRSASANEPPFVFEAAPPAPTAAAPPPAPPAPIAPAAGMAAPAAMTAPAPAADAAAQATADVATQRRESADAARAASQEAGAQAARPAAVVADMESAEPDEEVVPPATAASPQVRDAWLQRIRELARAGRIADARASLREFRHRYPGFALPDDLRALGE